jgi:hypothetical protein
LMGGIGLLHEDGEIHSRRPAADDVDFHLEVGQASLPVQVGSTLLGQTGCLYYSFNNWLAMISF